MFTRRTFCLGLLGIGTIGGAVSMAARPQWGRVAMQYVSAPVASPPIEDGRVFAESEEWAMKLIAAAENQIGKTLWYDGAYTELPYPNGDVPIERGVCTDVIIRAYRDGLNVDLQKLVHDDMNQNFTAYPAKWGLKRPDSNIDHRRVPNLQVFFTRRKSSLPVSNDGAAYLPGDVVTMELPGKLTHIAVVTHRPSDDGLRPLCVHNIGAGARLDDTLFAFELTGHYRFKPS